MSVGIWSSNTLKSVFRLRFLDFRFSGIEERGSGAGGEMGATGVLKSAPLSRGSGVLAATEKNDSGMFGILTNRESC